MPAEKILEQPAVEKTTGAPSRNEKIRRPEIKAEQIPVPTDKAPERFKAAETAGAAKIATTSVAQDFQKQQAAAIDDILAEGLTKIYLQMTPDQQKEFRRRGEETVAKINELLGKTKVKIGQIVELIRKWLKLVPGINRFFLEQEAKIKADKIMNLRNKLH